jgi:ribosomal protein S12 methylthiotransferase accessory factor
LSPAPIAPIVEAALSSSSSSPGTGIGDVVLGSSVRSVPAEVTLERARRLARRLGITRVTDITRLDRVGVPVYTSIRPGAVDGSLCVNAGKGLRPVDAEVGATMEAIEFALAEPGASRVRPVAATARDVLDGRRRPEAILDLCPKAGATIHLDAPMSCVAAREITTGHRALLPAELVFLPFRPSGRRRTMHFGASSNGLASGNTLGDATVHALCEIVERDVRSFQAVRDTGSPVALDSVDGPAAALVDHVRASGLALHVRTADQGLGIPFFSAMLYDPQAITPHLLNAGYGCHPSRSVAFVRAVTEAAQGRLTVIHGGRDDLADHRARFGGWSAARKRARVLSLAAGMTRGRPVPFASVPDLAAEATTVDGCLRVLLGRLHAAGIDRVYRVAFLRPRDELQVVRVVVPRMESLTWGLARVGPRLRDHARAA